jgi:hypothetical protein
MGVSFYGRSQLVSADTDAFSAWEPIIRAQAISVNGTVVMFYITSVNMTAAPAVRLPDPESVHREHARAACRSCPALCSSLNVPSPMDAGPLSQTPKTRRSERQSETTILKNQLLL